MPLYPSSPNLAQAKAWTLLGPPYHAAVSAATHNDRDKLARPTFQKLVGVGLRVSGEPAMCMVEATFSTTKRSPILIPSRGMV